MAWFIAAWLLTSHGAAHGQNSYVSREYKIKAAYLYNFGKYIEWPRQAAIVSESGHRVFVIGVLGESPIYRHLEDIARSKTVNEMPILVRRIANASDMRPCHVLFVSTAADKKLIEAVFVRTQESSTMLVGDAPNILGRLAVISFFIESNNVKFQINPATAERCGLKVSSKLLRLGRIVGDE